MARRRGRRNELWAEKGIWMLYGGENATRERPVITLPGPAAIATYAPWIAADGAAARTHAGA